VGAEAVEHESLACSPLHRREPPLVVVDAIAQRAVLAQQIPHLPDRPAHGDQLRRQAHLGLRLPTLDALDAVDQVGAQLVEARVRLVDAFVRLLTAAR
jgi:hypothetical protein